MTIKDYLAVHNGDDIRSIGIYSVNEFTNEFDRLTDVIDAHVSADDLVKYEGLEIDHVHLWIYDDPDKDNDGNLIWLKHIRACIYVK